MKNMTKLIMTSFIIILLASFSAHAKESPDATGLKAALNDYKSIQLKGELKKTLDYTYPAVFKIVPKEAMLKALEQTSASGMAPKITSLEQQPELPLKKFDKGVFTNIPYAMVMSVNLIPENAEKEKREQMVAMTKDPEKLKAFTGFMSQMLKKNLGESTEVKLDTESLKFEIKKSGSYVAINENDTGWKFIDTTPNPMMKLENILPKEIYASVK